MKEEIKKFITNYGPILCALLCPIMSFLGTYYASKSAINEVYITEKYDISKIFFDKKIKEYENFYSLALQEIDFSNFTDDKIYIYIKNIKDIYSKMKKSSFVLFSLCEQNEVVIVEDIVSCYGEIYMLFLRFEKEFSSIKNSDDAMKVKKELIIEYTDLLKKMKLKLSTLKLSLKGYTLQFKEGNM